MPTTARIVLSPERRRMAQSLRRLLLHAGQSDNRLYARGVTFLPIFPSTDAGLQAALITVMDRLALVINPPIPT